MSRVKTMGEVRQGKQVSSPSDGVQTILFDAQSGKGILPARSPLWPLVSTLPPLPFGFIVFIRKLSLVACRLWPTVTSDFSAPGFAKAKG